MKSNHHMPFSKASVYTFFLFFLLIYTSQAQQVTKVTGRVTEADTGEPLSFANVVFKGTSNGTTTDIDGYYSLSSKAATDQLEVIYLGFDTKVVPVKIGEEQEINIVMGSTALELEVVEVRAKKKRYRKKNNPAVDLIRKVIENKNKNKLESFDYYALKKYEKVEFDISNIKYGEKRKGLLKKIKLLDDYIDTTGVNGKSYLPIFLQETVADIRYRKDPTDKKEYKDGIRTTTIEGIVDEENLTTMTEQLYTDVDIYDNNIELLTYQFYSPTATLAPDFYQFYIIDTLEFEGKQVIDLQFFPRNKLDYAFQGNMYIALDSTYRIIHVNLGVNKDINLNFVNSLTINQTFDEVKGEWVLVKDSIFADYSFNPFGSKNSAGLFGKRTVKYYDHQFNEPIDEKYFGGTENTIVDDSARLRPPAFWAAYRPVTLTEQEAGVYTMVDSLQKVPAFKRLLRIGGLIFTGYTDIGPIDIGPINTFYSFNGVEGFRVRLGGRTNLKLSNKLQLSGYGAYGFMDQRFKFFGSALWSFNKNFEEYPKHYVLGSVFKETKFPGQILDYIDEDNFLLSFKRGNNDRMMIFRSQKLDYFYESSKNFGFQIVGERRGHQPVGSLSFPYQNSDGVADSLDNIQTTELSVNLTFAPNAEYLNGKNFRYSLSNKYPIFKLYYTAGLKDVFNSDYSYHKLQFHIFKRFDLSFFGYTVSEFEAGRMWGEGIPYVLLFLPRANQTYSYQIRAYNMMNYLEFIYDQYVSVNIRHYFNGFFLNKIPLIRKLKLREVVSFKGIYGQLSNGNNPNINPELIQFITEPRGENGERAPISYPLQLDEPYMELSFGISNIFKVLRIDLVKRLTYLNNPEVPGLGKNKGLTIRVRLAVEF